MVRDLGLNCLFELVVLLAISDVVLPAELTRQLIGLVALEYRDCLGLPVLHVYSEDHFDGPGARLRYHRIFSMPKSVAAEEAEATLRGLAGTCSVVFV